MPHFTYVAPDSGHHRRRHDELSTHHHRAGTHHSRRQDPQRVDPPDFRFCVELGLVLRSRKRNHKTVTGLEDELSKQLTRAGIANHLASTHTSPVSSREWTIASELCIPSRPTDHRFGMKLVSPFLRFSKRPESWQGELRAVMDALNTHFELTTTHQCFTHIHMAPASGVWHLDQVKGLAKSALYFERCLDALVPPYRRKSVWAKSNRNNFYFEGLRMAECFERVDAQASFEGVGARMNWCSAASPTGVALGATPGADFQHDAYRWNFCGLTADGLGTIEFRQPPGSASASEAIAWVMLVGCLARLSCGAGGALKPAEKPQLKSLGEWLVYEAEWCGIPHKGLLKDLIKQAVPVTPTPGTLAGMDADAITIDEDQRLRWKANDRNVVLEKYRRLLKHV
ncbi:hypothetical protein C8A01DRAFT_38558 [Parachaetomium inaequale]|uniref:Amidoligase enzyme n=1 Tax=Parachaetomium inaequale TaxID=2588326 RepID=A0AAN6PEM7_9PEZI|nr:hypothetical protein C8A01DRAFT_38558 [Parachaetomium inaequale]